MDEMYLEKMTSSFQTFIFCDLSAFSLNFYKVVTFFFFFKIHSSEDLTRGRAHKHMANMLGVWVR